MTRRTSSWTCRCRRQCHCRHMSGRWWRPRCCSRMTTCLVDRQPTSRAHPPHTAATRPSTFSLVFPMLGISKLRIIEIILQPTSDYDEEVHATKKHMGGDIFSGKIGTWNNAMQRHTARRMSSHWWFGFFLAHLNFCLFPVHIKIHLLIFQMHTYHAALTATHSVQPQHLMQQPPHKLLHHTRSMVGVFIDLSIFKI